MSDKPDTGAMPWPKECDHKRATCEEVGCPNAAATGAGGDS